MEIVKHPHPALRFKSVPVRQIDANLRRVVRGMFDLMYEAKGIGLAANQVALPLRVFVINLSGEDAEPEEEHVFINPVIRGRKGGEVAEEGCLSLPQLFADVRRPSAVTIEAFDLDGAGFEMKLDELPARVVQHELDHLDGVMFTDKLTAPLTPENAARLAEFEKEHRDAQTAGTRAEDAELLAAVQAIADAGVPPDFDSMAAPA